MPAVTGQRPQPAARGISQHAGEDMMLNILSMAGNWTSTPNAASGAPTGPVMRLPRGCPASSVRRGNLGRLRFPIWVWCWAGTLAVGLAVAPPDAASQPLRAQAQTAEEPGEAGVSLAPVLFGERQTLRLLKTARELVEQGRYAEAIRCFAPLIQERDDAFIPPESTEAGGTTLQSVRRAAFELIGELPDDAFAGYEREFGPEAQTRLDRALSERNADELALVSGTYFHTQAGYDATFLLGLQYLDRGSPLAAAITLKRLRDECRRRSDYEPALSIWLAVAWYRAGEPERAEETLVSACSAYAQSPVVLGGEEIAWFSSSEDALRWLEGEILSAARELTPSRDWHMYRGAPSRNGVVAEGAPVLATCWRSPMMISPELERLAEDFRFYLSHSQVSVFPLAAPLAVGDYVLARTPERLVAVDFRTGKRIWQSAGPEMLSTDRIGREDSPFAPQRGDLLAQLAEVRLFGDQTYNRLASDGKRVFAVEDVGFPSPAAYNLARVSRNNDFSGPFVPEFNRLVAYDLANGKILWHVGGSAEDGSPLSLADTFFLGPPLPLDRKLYVLGDRQGEVLLFVLDPADGSVLWNQRLAVVDSDIITDIPRRTMGSAPAYAEGLLLCRATPSVTVAIDLTSRSLRWAHVAADGESAGDIRAGFNPFAAIRHAGRVLRQQDSWLDTTPMIADNAVLLPDPLSGQLICLELADGQQRWRLQPDDESGWLYVACADKGGALLVSGRGISSVDLQSGDLTSAGRRSQFPEGYAPAGTGYYNGAHYFLPLYQGRIAVIDPAGAVIERYLETPRARPLGNLVVHRGRIISQAAEWVEAFYETGALKAELAQSPEKTPDDPQALLALSLLLWQEDQTAQAVESAAELLTLAPGEDAREIASNMILEAIEADFARFAEYASIIEPRLQSTEERARYHRVLAEGYQRSGDYAAALQHCRALVEAILESDDLLLSSGNDYRVRCSAWVGRQLETLAEAAGAELQKELDGQVDRWLAEAAEGTPAVQERLLLCLAAIPRAELELRTRLAEEYRQQEEYLAAERHLLVLAESPDTVRAAGAWADLGEMYVEAGDFEAVAECVQAMEPLLAEIAAAEADSLAARWADLNALPEITLYMRAPEWPTGAVLVEKRQGRSPDGNTAAQSTEEILEFVGSRRPFYTHRNLMLSRQPQPSVRAIDGWGRDLWTVEAGNMDDTAMLIRELAPRATKAQTEGHLILLHSGSNVTAINSLGKDGQPAILWGYRAGSRPQGDQLTASRRTHASILAMAPDFDTPVETGVLGGGLVYIQHIGTLLVADGINGRVRWYRENLPPADRVFGDQRHVVWCCRESHRTIVFDARDGSKIRESGNAAYSNRLGSFGHYVLARELSQSSVNDQTLRLWDVTTDKVVWESPVVHRNAAVTILPDKLVACADPTGRLLLLDLHSGELLFMDRVAPLNNPLAVYLLEAEDRYLLVTNERATRSVSDAANSARRAGPIRNMPTATIDAGRVYAISRTGEMLWDEPAEVYDTFLPLDQPSRLPVLVFAGTYWRQQGTSRHSESRVEVIDKRTGRTICQESLAQPSAFLQIVGDPHSNMVLMEMQQGGLVLELTDQPIGTPGDAGEPPPDQLNPIRMLEGLFRAIDLD